MRWSLVALSVLCVVLGAIPVTITDALSGVVQPLIGTGFAVSSDLGWPFLSPVSNTRGSYSGTVLVMIGLSLFGIAIALVHRIGNNSVRAADAWDCGTPEDNPATQYSGQSFAQPLRRSLAATVFQARETVVMPQPGDEQPARHKVSMIDPIWVGLYLWLAKAVDAIADKVNRLQYLTVRRYLLMMFCTLVFLLLVVAVRQRQ
jgi:hypothetical protein